MANKNQVTLTLAGDSTNLEKAFDKVGASSRGMADDIDKASRSAGEGFDKMGDGIDNTGSKAGDMESGFRGVTDSMSGFSAIAKGDVMGGLTDLAGGAEALATGFSGVLLPALKASKIGMAAATVATKAQTIAMRAQNMVMRANPIGLVVTAIFLLVGAFILAYKKSETFRNIVQGAMRGVQTAFGWVLDKGRDMLGWFRGVPGKVRGFFSGLAGIVTAPFRAAFGAIRDLWNSTIGGFSISIPKIGGFGGQSFTIPTMHTGGVMPGAPGTEGLALLMAGERVTPVGGYGGRTVIELRSDGSKLMNLLVELLRQAIRTGGGDVQVVLGAR